MRLSYGASMGLRNSCLLDDDAGQTTVEYAMVVSLAAITIALALAVAPSGLFGSFWSAVRTALL
jgi:Flp pilus assembly pilin Flp